MYPLTGDQVYWFVCFNGARGGRRLSDPGEVRAEAMRHLGGGSWADRVVECVRRTGDEELSYSDVYPAEKKRDREDDD